MCFDLRDCISYTKKWIYPYLPTPIPQKNKLVKTIMFASETVLFVFHYYLIDTSINGFNYTNSSLQIQKSLVKLVRCRSVPEQG